MQSQYPISLRQGILQITPVDKHSRLNTSHDLHMYISHYNLTVSKSLQ